MSDYLALGGVSSTLKTLLNDRMEIPSLLSGDDDIAITISTPTKEDDESDLPRINLFLYRVTENTFLKNQEIPGHGHPAAYGHPPLSLELHYLITPYGKSMETGQQFANETLAQYLLASAMRVFHDYPIITSALTTSAGQPILDPSLQNQFEKIILYLDQLSLDDMTKVWTALTLPYRLSVAYTVSVVQVESQRQRPYPRLVGELPDAGPRVQVITMSTPYIEQLLVKRQEMSSTQQSSSAPYARIGDRLDLAGSGFNRDDMRVQLGSVLCDPLDDPALTSKQLSVRVPDDVKLQPGPLAISVVRQVSMGKPPEDRPGFKSNVAVFMLVPHVKTAELTSDTITVTGTRLWAENKDCQTILGDQVVFAKDYTIATPTQIAFALPVLNAGTYLVRVRVNGAESIDTKTITVT